MLKLDSVSKKFGTKKAVNDLSFELKEGQILGLLGQNGAGKTTTFRMILNILSPTSGFVTLDGVDSSKMNYKKVGFLTEERSLMNTYTVYNQLMFFAELKGMKIKDADSSIDYWLNYFDLMDMKSKNVKELSKGNQQKIQFISSFIHNPKLLILDEPFSGLDPFNISIFKKVILDLKEKGTAIIFSSHRLDHVELFCDDVIVLVNGKTVLNGNIKNLKTEADIFNVKFIGDIDKSLFEKAEFISDLKVNGNSFEFIMSSYENKEVLNKIIKKAESIEKFVVELPTFEEIFVRKVGEFYE